MSVSPVLRALDLTNCDREPIHVPGAIQPHGVLLVLREPDLEVIQASENAETVFGTPAAELLGQRLEALLPLAAMQRLRFWLPTVSLDRPALMNPPVSLGSLPQLYDAILHRTDGGLVLELELRASVADETPAFLQAALERLQQAQDVQALCDVAAHEIRRLTGFDRVKVYRFDADWHGETIAEDRADYMDAYLGLHFPASDIPQQARRLYTLNRIRIIPDVEYEPAHLVPAVNPDTGAALDMSFSVLRSVSPVHVTYLKNMDVCASMSISIVRDGQLWGLVACHHARPYRLPYRVRTACELFGQVLAVLLTSTQEGESRQQQVRRRDLQVRLLEAMVRADDFVAALVDQEEALLSLVGARGAAIVSREQCLRFGEAPQEAAVRALAAWLEAQDAAAGEVFETDRLAHHYPEAEAYQETASGLLAISLSRLQRYYVLWFRPEVPQTVYWAGDPNKAVTRERANGGQETQLHPRTSFQAWKDTLRGRAQAWSPAEVEAARTLRRAISDVVFVKLEKLARLNASLEQANRWLRQRNQELQDFAYVASHDLQEPLRKIRSFSDLLQTEHAAQLDARGLHYLARMAHAAERMSTLVADLLGFSRVVTHAEPFEDVDLAFALEQVLSELDSLLAGAGAHVEADPLPHVEADPEQMRRLFHHLVSNAVKFRRADVPPHVRITCEPLAGGDGPAYRICVEDNGQGFDEKYLDRIFLPFQRLNPHGTHEGTGIGLAISRRIVERHGGTLTAHSRQGEGSTFVVTLPERLPLTSRHLDPGAA